MPKERKKRKVNSKTAYEILAKNKKLLKQQFVKFPSSKVREPTDQITTINEGLLSDFRLPNPAPYLSQVGCSDSRASIVDIDQQSLNAFHRPIPPYPNASYPSQVGYSDSIANIVAENNELIKQHSEERAPTGQTNGIGLVH